MLYIHRLSALLGILFVLWVCATGAALQSVDMVTVLSNAPATDPNMLAVREHIDGPGNYSVITPADYTATTLPAGFDYAAAVAKVTAAARAAARGASLRLVELRVVDGKAVGHVQMDRQQLLFDATTGTSLPASNIPETPRGAESSLRNQIKNLHKGGFLGRIGTTINEVAGIALSFLIVTGLIKYYQLLVGRLSLGRRSAFWFSGGWWRSLHRWISVGASVVVIWLTGTGLLLATDCLVQTYNIAEGAAHHIDRHDVSRDVSSPMTDGELPAMLRTTLAAYQNAMPGTAVKTLRLRYFSGSPQGVVIADDSDTSQLVFNAVTGKPMSETEAGYPDTGFMFGWQGHEFLKRIHRGDYFGMTGRWLEYLGSFALLYLTISGAKMYYDLWRRRSKTGRPALVW